MPSNGQGCVTVCVVEVTKSLKFIIAIIIYNLNNELQIWKSYNFLYQAHFILNSTPLTKNPNMS